MVILGLVSYKKVAGLMNTPDGRKATGGFQKMLSSAIAAPKCGQSLLQIRGALESYRTDHKQKYPATLSALVPDYLPDKSVISVGDVALQPAYTPPKTGSSAETPIVSYDLGNNNLINMKEAAVSQQIIVVLRKDGRIFSNQIQRTEMFPPNH